MFDKQLWKNKISNTWISVATSKITWKYKKQIKYFPYYFLVNSVFDLYYQIQDLHSMWKIRG